MKSTRDGHKGPMIGIGAVLVGICLLVAAWGLRPDVRPLFEPIKEWQDLIGAALALLAAVYGANYVLSQIRQVDRIEAERGRRAATAARSVMPLTLNTLSIHAREAGEAALQLVGTDVRVRPPRSGLPRFPPPPSSVISELQAFILTAPEAAGEMAAQIISEIQIMHASAEGVWTGLSQSGRGHIVMRANVEAVVARAALVDARVSALFPYARRETDLLSPVEESDVLTALKIIRAYPEVYPDIARMAQKLWLQAGGVPGAPAPVS